MTAAMSSVAWVGRSRPSGPSVANSLASSHERNVLGGKLA
jgi:hypothetical protein